MMDFLHEHILPHFNYWVYIVLMMVGLYAMITKNNLIKKLIGMSIFQTAIILFFVSLGVKADADIPILHHHAHGNHPEEASHPAEVAASQEDPPQTDPEFLPAPASHGTSIDPDDLPHVLMLTAIVVGVATLGTALAVAQLIFHEYGTLEETEILAQITSSDG